MERKCYECGEVFARRKAGGCPKCGAKVKAYKNLWVTEFPTAVLIRKYEGLIRGFQERNGEEGLLFKIPTCLVGKETKGADGLLSICGGNLDLALKVMVYLATSKRYAEWFYQTSSLWHLRSAYTRSVGVVQKIEREKEEQQSRQQKEIDNLEKKYGDLF